MKKSTLTFIILSAFFIATAQFVYAGKSWEYKHWSVSSYDDFVRYIAHGDTVYGHQFGFLKKSGNCDSNILWISVSTPDKDLKLFEGINATIQIKIDETQFQAELSILAVSKITPSLSTIAFSNFLAGEKFIALLEKGQKAEITILAPDELLNKLDITTDTFSLKGFTATMLKAKEFCESESRPSIDNENIHPDVFTKAEQGDVDAPYSLGLM